MTLRKIDPTKTPGRFAVAYAALAATRPARFVSRHVNWKVDPLLLRITGGRFASTLVYPTALLETRGARTGRLRRNAVIYFNDGDRVVIVASNAGAPTHPGWLHNIRARPDAVTLGGDRMLAREVDDETELERLWTLADRVFPAFASYRRDATATSRRIPIVVLEPCAAAR
jgi:deazaflavin-dependent oxidoreductase (nitroreductase family)